jgi:hypothetical protein
MPTLQTYFNEILSKLKRTRSQKRLIFTFLTGSPHMTLCCLCAAVVNNISRNFDLYAVPDLPIG